MQINVHVRGVDSEALEKSPGGVHKEILDTRQGGKIT